MRVAITGGLGFIGKQLAKKLLEKHDVTIVDIRTDDYIDGVDFQFADLRRSDQAEHALSEVDVVFHLAGTVLNVARKNPRLAVELDILGTLNVLEACVKNHVGKIVYASSFYVYDGLSPRAEVDEEIVPNLFGAEMFGVVKIAAERLVYEYERKYGLRYVILRYGPIYGPSRRCTSVICDFIKMGLEKKPIVIWGRGERKNQYTYVEDVVEGSVKAMEYDNEVFNLISPERVTIKEVAEILSKKYGFAVDYDLTKPEGPSMPYISPQKAIEKLGWKPTSLEEGIEKTYKGFRKKLP